MLGSFRGGVHPNDSKSHTNKKSIETMPPPERVCLPMTMHIGAPGEPLVRAGSIVKYGQKIADSPAAVSAPIHSPVSGRVLAVEPRPHPGGGKVLSVVIENDFEDTPSEDIRPYGSAESLGPEDIIGIVRSAGIVGLGGAAFPTHFKLRSSMGKTDKIIINASECEPYITCDHRIMLERPEEIIGGIKAIMKVLSIQGAVIAVESNKYDAVERLKKTLPRKNSSIIVKTTRTRYPQGAEKQLVATVTGRKIPPGQLPSSVGCVVFNVSTVAAIHRAITTGMPLVNRLLTVSGSAVSNPKNLSVRIGSSLKSIFDFTGGFKEEPSKIIIGGPMMGSAQHNLEVPVLKSTNGLLAFTKREITPVKNPVCIRCGKCADTCPMNLTPVTMYMYEQNDMLYELERMNISDCIECGCCSYICPGRLYLTQSFKTGKKKIKLRDEITKESAMPSD